MASDSEHREAPRKTLDEIRREIEAEYIDLTEGPAAARDAAPDPRPREGAQQRRRAPWSEREDVGDTTDAAAGAFRTIADRHPLVGRSRDVADDRPRRTGYLIAGLVGCFAGQVLLLAFLTVARYSDWPDGGKTGTPRPRTEATTRATAPLAKDDSRLAPQGAPRADAPAASPTSPWSPVSSTPPPESTPDRSEALPPPAAEPRPPSPPVPAVVSSATLADGSPSRPVGGPPPRVAPEPRHSSPRPPGALSASERLAAQARLRSALTQWHRASASGDVPVQLPEPVIVLSPDGRTAKTYVSLPSPIGLIPREQRWELAARGGWNLVEDRQAGLPVPGTAPGSRGR